MLRGFFSADIHPPRRNWLDWSRVLCLYLVVFGHTSLDDSGVNVVLSAFRMPLFFLFAGFNSKHGTSLLSQFRRNVRTLLVPYLGFWALLYPFWLFVVAPRHPDHYDLSSLTGTMVKPLAGLLLGLGYDTPWSYAVSGPLWFLVALFSVRTMHGMLTHWSKDSVLTMLLLTIAVPATVLALPSGAVLPLSLGSAALAYPFYVVGILVRRGSFPTAKRWLRSYPLVFALALFCLLTPLAASNGRIMIACMDLGQSTILFYPTAIVGCITFASLGLFLDKWTHPILVWISKSSLPIMALHLVFIAFGKRYLPLQQFTDSIDSSIVAELLLSGFAMCACLPVIILLNRVAPWLTGRIPAEVGMPPKRSGAAPITLLRAPRPSAEGCGMPPIQAVHQSCQPPPWSDPLRNGNEWA